MVIQRWQSVLLLLAVVLMCIFCSTPFATRTVEGTLEASDVFISEAPVLLVLNILVAVLLFIAIFLFKNLRLQMRVTLISMVLIATSMAGSAFVVYGGGMATNLIWVGGVLLLLAALVCALAALRFMRRDRNLLRSYDRLR